MDRVLFFSLQVAPAHRPELLDALVAHGRACVGAEPKTLRFDVLEDDADPNRLYIYEAYADQAAFDAHTAGDSHRQAVAVLNDLREREHCTVETVVRAHSAFAGPHA